MDGKAEIDPRGGMKCVWRVEGEMERKAEVGIVGCVVPVVAYVTIVSVAVVVPSWRRQRGLDSGAVHVLFKLRWEGEGGEGMTRRGIV